MTRKEFLKSVVSLMEQGKICCICGAPIEDFGNNPYPCVTDEGARCCDECNYAYVIPARIATLSRKETNNE